MIRKSVRRISEKIMLNQGAKAMTVQSNLIAFWMAARCPRAGKEAAVH
jgi:hypothetical protein